MKNVCCNCINGQLGCPLDEVGICDVQNRGTCESKEALVKCDLCESIFGETELKVFSCRHPYYRKYNGRYCGGCYTIAMGFFMEEASKHGVRLEKAVTWLDPVK